MVQKTVSVLIVMLFFLGSCKIDRKGSIDRDKFSFKVRDDNYLFFRNVRSAYYEIQDLPKAKWIAYRYSDRLQSSTRPVITPVIVVDWFRNEAYVLVEPNEVLQNESALIVRELNRSTGRSYEYQLGERGRENMLEFATKVYEGIMAENELTVQFQNKFVPLFESPEEADQFRLVLSDYYRLTNIF